MDYVSSTWPSTSCEGKSISALGRSQADEGDYKYRKVYVSSPVENGRAAFTLETSDWSRLLAGKREEAAGRMAKDGKRQMACLHRQLGPAKGMTIKERIPVPSVHKRAVVKITVSQGSNRTFADAMTQMSA